MAVRVLLLTSLLAASLTEAAPGGPKIWSGRHQEIVPAPTPNLELLQTVTIIDGDTITIAPPGHEVTAIASKSPSSATDQATLTQPTSAPQAPDLRRHARQGHKRAATPTTLAEGQYWLRAVESPNFHQYLQTNPANEPGPAILGSYTTAGQFNIVDGQLVEDTFTTNGGAPLYLNVEQPANLSAQVAAGQIQRTLRTWFNTTQNAFGNFSFQGDAVVWSTPLFTRQNEEAWLVCGNQTLYINTGAYDYMDPTGCVDETINYYNAATAVD